MIQKRGMYMSKQESKRDKFVRLAEKRANEILERIRILGHCSNKSQYEYDEKQITKIFSAIESEIKTCRMKYKFNTRSKLKLS